MKKYKKIVFLTGATGVVGSHLLKTLLENGCMVYVLARRRKGESAYCRVVKNLKFWCDGVHRSRKYRNFKVLEGDIAKKNLGLKNADLKEAWMCSREVFHCAALTSFSNTLAEARAVNCDGTKRLLDLSSEYAKKGQLHKINCVSTIYICGNYNGNFDEKDTDKGQEFSTPYLQSKLEAEKAILKYQNQGLWVNILRPPVVVGDSKTGKILSFKQAFYRAMRIWSAEIFDRFPCTRQYQFPIIFVDELCQSIYRISSDLEIKNKVYHLFHCKPPSLALILKVASRVLKLKKTKFISYDKFIAENLTPVQAQLIKHNFFFLNNDVRLQSMETNKILEGINFVFSQPKQNNIIELLRYAQAAGFLNRKFASCFN